MQTTAHPLRLQKFVGRSIAVRHPRDGRRPAVDVVVDLYRTTSILDSEGRYARRFVPGGVVGEQAQGAPRGQFGDGTLLFMRMPAR